MKIKLLFWIVMLFSFTYYGFSYNYLITGKRPTSIIVIGENASEQEIIAAEILREYILKMTGVKIPVYRDDFLDPINRNLVVSIGKTRWLPASTRKELKIDSNLPDNDPLKNSFLIEKQARYMILAGQRDEGTVYAVYYFLHRLGCKFSPQKEEMTEIPANQANVPDYYKFRDFFSGYKEIKKIDETFLKDISWIKEKIIPTKRNIPDVPFKQKSWIVKDGKSSSVIVVGSHAFDKEIYAAEQLQQYLKKMTGVDIKIMKDYEKIPEDMLPISIGRTVYLTDEIKEQLQIGKNLLSLNPEFDAYAIIKKPGILYLVGHRDQGTIWAVFDFLEQLGCRWFFGNDAGTIIPEGLNQIKIDDMKIMRKPDFVNRDIYAWWGHFEDEKDIESEDYWRLVNRLSEGRPRGMTGHNFSQILPESLYESHPEYFSMIKGKRVNPKTAINWQMCMSNPEVINLSIEWARKRLGLEPANELITYAPNDGDALCTCPECRKIGNHADVNLYFAKKVGEKIFQEYPNTIINVWAYADGAVVPEKLKADGYEKNADRVLFTIFENSAATPMKKLVEGLAKSSHRLWMNKIWHIIGYDAGGIRPVNYTDTFSEVAFYGKNNVVAFSLQAVPHWASNGFYLYTMARLMWDTDADVQTIRKDFCEKMFPSASKEFREFLDLYDLKGKYARRPYGSYHPENLTERPDEISWQEWLSRGLDILEKIRQKAASEGEKKRWQFYALYMHEQVLEWEIVELQGTDEEKVYRFMELISFLKGINDMRVVQSNMAIGKGFGGPTRGSGYPGRDLEFNEIPAMPINDEVVMKFFEKDRKKYPCKVQR